LKRNRAARAVWDGLSFSHRREYVSSIVEAKKEETRARRVERTIQALTQRRYIEWHTPSRRRFTRWGRRAGGS
jgi:uncharacterized protein YdeI (YjbR/CyaY-like superfamily)